MENSSRFYMRLLEQTIHTVVLATFDEHGFPVTAAIDLMDSDEHGLYFLTAKGKRLYKRLQRCRHIALTGIKGNDTMSSLSVSVHGKVREIGTERLERLLKKNPYMLDIYPTPASRQALRVFCLYEGEGEFFDLSKKPIERASFAIGHEPVRAEGYFITDQCDGCGKCLAVCPQSCIDLSAVPAVIEQEHCLRCGNCMDVCPQEAVIRK